MINLTNHKSAETQLEQARSTNLDFENDNFQSRILKKVLTVQGTQPSLTGGVWLIVGKMTKQGLHKTDPTQKKCIYREI